MHFFFLHSFFRKSQTAWRHQIITARDKIWGKGNYEREMLNTCSFEDFKSRSMVLLILSKRAIIAGHDVDGVDGARQKCYFLDVKLWRGFCEISGYPLKVVARVLLTKNKTC
jgi:hypothetical protein